MSLSHWCHWAIGVTESLVSLSQGCCWVRGDCGTGVFTTGVIITGVCLALLFHQPEKLVPQIPANFYGGNRLSKTLCLGKSRQDLFLYDVYWLGRWLLIMRSKYLKYISWIRILHSDWTKLSELKVDWKLTFWTEDFTEQGGLSWSSPLRSDGSWNSQRREVGPRERRPMTLKTKLASGVGPSASSSLRLNGWRVGKQLQEAKGPSQKTGIVKA